MMTPYITVAEHGRIVSCGFVQEEVVELMRQTDGACLICGVSIADPSLFYWDGETAQPIPDRPSDLHAFDYATRTWMLSEVAVRQRRDKLLSESDWTQLPDVPAETKAAWAEYRQALRDLTDQPGFPEGVLWPVAPN